MADDSRIPFRQEDLLERNTGDAVVVMKATGDVIHTLQGTALFIWNMIDGSRSIKEINDELTARYDVDKDCALTDMDRFIALLLESGLIIIE